jgi:hypothetical protein
MEAVVPLLVALVLILLAWKFLAGVVKTVVLVAILAVAALFVFGML